MSPWHPAFIFAIWFGAGKLPWAPGTWGSLAALPFAWIIGWLGGPALLAAATLLACLLGYWSCNVVVAETGAKDPGEIVIDEVAGQWLTLTLAPLDPMAYGLGFLLFRLFDILKPWPAGWVDRKVSGGAGIMLDDIIAGAYAGILLYFIWPLLQ